MASFFSGTSARIGLAYVVASALDSFTPYRDCCSGSNAKMPPWYSFGVGRKNRGNLYDLLTALIPYLAAKRPQRPRNQSMRIITRQRPCSDYSEKSFKFTLTK